jgi:transcriptional regulator with XRE-family HTH domain
MSQPRRTFTPTPAYRLFLKSVVQTRIDRGYSLEQLAEFLGLTPAQVASFEAGQHPLGFIDVRNWLLALDMPFTQFTQQIDDALDSTLTADESIIYPGDEPDDLDKFARADPLPHQIPNIQVLFFAPGEIPEVRRIENTLEAKQALVGGLITTFETGIDGTIGIANDEALLCDMPFNREIIETSAHIFGPFLVAGDAPQGFRSLAPFELERTLDALCPELSQEQFPAIISQLDGGAEWMEMWN